MARRHKKKRLFLTKINIVFTLLVLGEFVVATGLSLLLKLVLEGILQIKLSSGMWILIIGSMMGTGIAYMVNIIFFTPIQNLNDAMNDVADGDFSVRLESKSKINEVAELYDSFDLMVKELEATEELQSDFVSNVSHEIKTPVNAIEGYAMLLQDSQCSREEQQEYIDKILFNTTRLSELVGNVLLLSKIDNQAISRHEKVFRLDEQVRESIMQLETKWTEKNIELDVDMDEISFKGDASLFIHIWNNLIGNAIKFSPEGGTIRIRLFSAEDGVKFIIDDEGPGIKDLGKIFNKFYQEDSSRKAEGNGLGLALVKRIVDTYEGSIRAENLSEKGSRFTVILPAML